MERGFRWWCCYLPKATQARMRRRKSVPLSGAMVHCPACVMQNQHWSQVIFICFHWDGEVYFSEEICTIRPPLPPRLFWSLPTSELVSEFFLWGFVTILPWLPSLHFILWEALCTLEDSTWWKTGLVTPCTVEHCVSLSGPFARGP